MIDGAALAVLALSSSVLVLVALHSIAWARETILAAKARRQAEITCSVNLLCEKIRQRFAPDRQSARGRQFRGLRQVPEAEAISIAFEDVGLALPNGSQVLEGVTGHFEAGHLAAIMGPSGAGKTTLLNVLADRAGYGRVGGRITVNGEACSIERLAPVVGFVPQDDIVYETLTVAEQIRLHATLRNSPMAAARLRDIMEDVLDVLDLSAIRDAVVGSVEERGISGGQRKRVNIGLELAACPTLLFLDEPTSGLDSSSCLRVVDSLKRMTSLNMTIVAVVHQPRYTVFSMFDDLLLLGQAGRTVYRGPAVKARSYFESLGFSLPLQESVADWIIDVVAGVWHSSDLEVKPHLLPKIWEEKREAMPSDVLEREDAEELLLEDQYILNQNRLRSSAQDIWDQLDSCKAGSLHKSQFKELLVAVANATPTEEVVSKLFKQIDIDQSDSIHFDEFVCFVEELSGLRFDPERLLRRFSLTPTGRSLSAHPGSSPVSRFLSLPSPCCKSFSASPCISLASTHTGASLASRSSSLLSPHGWGSPVLPSLSSPSVHARDSPAPQYLGSASLGSDGSLGAASGSLGILLEWAAMDDEEKEEEEEEEEEVPSPTSEGSLKMSTPAEQPVEPEQLCDLEVLSQGLDVAEVAAESECHSRRGRAWFSQLALFTQQTLIHLGRQKRRQALDLALFACGASICGAVQEYTQEPGNIVFTQICLALLTSVASLKAFGTNRLVLWRERGCGLSSSASFMARLLVESFCVLLQTSIFTSLYFLASGVQAPFHVFWIPFMMVAYTAAGWAYSLSLVLPTQSGTLAVATVQLVLNGVLGDPNRLKDWLGHGGLQEAVSSVSITRWSVPMLMIPLWESTQFSKAIHSDYHREVLRAYKSGEDFGLGYWNAAVFVLFCQMIFLRILGYLALRCSNRTKS